MIVIAIKLYSINLNVLTALNMILLTNAFTKKKKVNVSKIYQFCVFLELLYFEKKLHKHYIRLFDYTVC